MLKPDPRNARRHSDHNKARIRQSLELVGAGRGLLADRDNIIRAGNGVYEQAKSLGYKFKVVDVAPDELIVSRRADLHGKEAERAAMLDNLASDTSAWDYEADRLAELVRGDDVLQLIAREEAQLRELLCSADGSESDDEHAAELVDKAAQLQKVWQVKRSDVWEIPSRSVKGKAHRVMCGDSASASDVARLMQGELCDLIVIDPPYGVSYADKNKFLNSIAKGNRIQKPISGDDGKIEDIAKNLWRPAFDNLFAVARDGCVIYSFAPQGGDQMMMMMMMMQASFPVRHELIWLKNNHVLGRVDYAYKHEPILYAWKKGGHKFYGGFQTSVLECNKPLSSNLHPTMKPVELVARLIENSSLSNEIVLDVFLGSGTTAIAAENLGRICYGLDIAPQYVSVALQRLQDTCGLTPRRVT